MATTAATVAPSNATAAEFRAWAQFVHDVFSNAGWVQTADTGQINLTTVAAPGAANTKMGYEIWRMADAHQTAAPIYLKLAYGSGNNALYPGLWFTIGTGTDGAGALVDTADNNRPAYLLDFYSQSAPAIACATNSAVTRECFGSGTTDRAVFLLFEAKPVLTGAGTPCAWTITTGDNPGAEANFVNVFSIERGRDANGATVDTHIIVTWSGTLSRITRVAYVKTSNKWVPLDPPTGANTLRPDETNNIDANRVSGYLYSNMTAYPINVFEQNTKPAWPGVNVVVSSWPLFAFDTTPVGHLGNCVGYTGNYISGRTAGISPYGTARTYRTCAGMRVATHATTNSDGGGYVYILYE